MRCWRCEAENVQLYRDPMVGDLIGVCLPCAQVRWILSTKRKTTTMYYLNGRLIARVVEFDKMKGNP